MPGAPRLLAQPDRWQSCSTFLSCRRLTSAGGQHHAQPRPAGQGPAPHRLAQDEHPSAVAILPCAPVPKPQPHPPLGRRYGRSSIDTRAAHTGAAAAQAAASGGLLLQDGLKSAKVSEALSPRIHPSSSSEVTTRMEGRPELSIASSS